MIIDPYKERQKYKLRRKLRKKARKQLKTTTKKSCIVYGLYDEEGSIRYIGQTRQDLDKRVADFYRSIKASLHAGRKLSPVESWINSGAKFEARTIDDEATWDVSEIIWIDRHLQQGIQLLNVLRGGQDTYAEVLRASAG